MKIIAVPITGNTMRICENTVSRIRQAVANDNLLLATLLVCEHFNAGLGHEYYVRKMEAIANEARPLVDTQATPTQQFTQLIQAFYQHFAFSGNEHDFYNAKFALLDYVLEYRTGIPVTLAITFCEIAKRLGLTAKGVNFPGHFIIACEISEASTIYLDPLSGDTMSWCELEKLYLSIVGDADDEMPLNILDAASTSVTLTRLLHNLKASFIREENYHFALSAVDLLIELSPSDPYERRDRGYLLHQLECPQVAKADYQFFIQHCPQDPSAQLLKLQMRHWESLSEIVLH